VIDEQGNSKPAWNVFREKATAFQGSKMCSAD
jgi:hypothetical protein